MQSVARDRSSTLAAALPHAAPDRGGAAAPLPALQRGHGFPNTLRRPSQVLHERAAKRGRRCVSYSRLRLPEDYDVEGSTRLARVGDPGGRQTCRRSVSPPRLGRRFTSARRADRRKGRQRRDASLSSCAYIDGLLVTGTESARLRRGWDPRVTGGVMPPGSWDGFCAGSAQETEAGTDSLGARPKGGDLGR